MRLPRLAQSRFDVERAGEFDIVVAASGYEERAPFVSEALHNTEGEGLVFGFDESNDHPRRVHNDQVFAALGYRMVSCSGNDHESTAAAVSDAIARCPNDPVRIAIDITSMTRAWYWGIAKMLSEVTSDISLDVTYFYSIAEYEAPTNEAEPAMVIGPIRGLSAGLELPTSPISLCIGLGYDRDLALGLLEYIEPSETWLYYASPATDDQYVRDVRRNNKQLFSRVPAENVIRYPVKDLLHTYAQMESLASLLVRISRVILAPMGPKPFGLLSFFLTLKYPEIDAWRVSTGNLRAQKLRRPTGEVLSLRAVYSGQDTR